MSEMLIAIKQQSLFDYASLDEQIRSIVQEKADRISARTKRCAAENGQDLLEVKALLSHGQFLAWIHYEWGWSEDTAERQMNVARCAINNPQIAEFDQSAQYLLSRPNSKDALQEAIQRHDEGEKITYSVARQIVDEYKPVPIIAPDLGGDMAQEKRDNHVMRVMGSSESPEWYTPQGIVRLVAAFLGGIDLDPCSNSHETPNVPAHMHYTKEDDGLSQGWHGSVYLNPPYGSEIPQWIDKLVASHKRGDIEEAIALLPARIDTAWFQPLYEHPQMLMCNIRGRLQFENAQYSAPFPSIIVYLGEREQEFIEHFKEQGPIMRRVG